MHTNRIPRLALMTGALASLVLVGAIAPSTAACPEGDATGLRAGASSHPQTHPRFALHTWEGLACQFSNISVGVNHAVQSWGQPGSRMMRTLSINGAVFDPSGGRIYRLAGPPRVREITDAAGRDVEGAGQFNLYPVPPQSMGFVRPSNGQTSITFGLNMHSMPRVPRTIARLAFDVEVEVAADVKLIALPSEPQAEMVELAPNFHGRLSNFVIDKDGRLSLKLEYRIPLGNGPRPAFYQLELLDTTGAVIQSNYPPQEIITRDAIVGTHRVQGVNLGRRELGEIRLTIITDLVTHTFEIVEEDLPLLE